MAGAYTAAMEPHSLGRRTVALIAAYAMALQALWSTSIPVDLSVLASPAAIFCSHDEAGGAGHPARHDLPCTAVCAALGHGMAGRLPPVVAAAYAAPRVIAALAPTRDWVVPPDVIDGPQAPRGPPFA
jgi:hypothetical protein